MDMNLVLLGYHTCLCVFLYIKRECLLFEVVSLQGSAMTIISIVFCAMYIETVMAS